MEEEKVGIEELNNQLKMAVCDYDTAREAFDTERCKLKDIFEVSLLRFLPDNMIVKNSNIDKSWVDNSWIWQWNCSIVLPKYEFHSEFDFYFREGKGVAINNGSIGIYDRNNVGYIASVKAIANIWDNVDEIEKLFSRVSFEKLNELKEIEYKTEVDKNHIECQIKKIQEEEFEAKLFTVGTTIMLKEGRADYLFDTSVYVCPSHGDKQGYCHATVVKVTPKKAVFDIQYGRFANYNYTDTKSIKKNCVIQAIKEGSWKIVKNN